jgi:hypothetical protein
MQGPIYPDLPSEGRKDGFFYQRRWMVPVMIGVLINVLYVLGLRSIMLSTPIEDLEVSEFLNGPSFLLFSILPFSDSYYASLELAYSNPAPVLLVVHCHAFILLTSGLVLLLMLIKIKDLTRYITDAKRRALRDLSWSHYFNATRMSFWFLCPSQ